MSYLHKIFLPVILLTFSQGCLDEGKQAETIFRHYLNQKTEIIRNHSKESSLALWNVWISGKESDYTKLINIELDFNKANQANAEEFNPDNFSTITRNVFTDEKDFDLLKKLKHSGLITDTLLSRQLTYLYHLFVGSQIGSDKYKKLLESQVKLSRSPGTLKYYIDENIYNTRQLDSLRENSGDNQLLGKIIKAVQPVAQRMAPDIIRLVKNRNEVALALGLPDYYHVQFESKDISVKKVKALIDEIELMTREPYLEAKQVIDKKLAKRYRIKVEELRPWHYNDVNKSYLPLRFTLTLDSLLRSAEPVKRAAGFFDGIGLNIQSVIDKSELKNATMSSLVNIDFRNDLRLIGRITDSFGGLTEIMHLGGHAAHYTHISEEIPYLLQSPNLIVAEGVARYFENLAYDRKWLGEVMPLDEKTGKEVGLIMQHFWEVDRLFRIRKQMVTADFEREIYSDPEQDLDYLWSELNFKYLGIRYPDEKGACFWATEKYLTSLPCYIQNHILADIVAAQLKHAIDVRVLDGGTAKICNNKKVGEYLINNLFRYGDRYPWEELIEKSTGEILRSQYYVSGLIGNENEKEMKSQ
jgi:peptidyl-dipeptidase A